MSANFTKIEYSKLNARQKENYNFLKVSGILADYGFMTMRLSDDWEGADFIAVHIDGMKLLKVQLKGRFVFDKKYMKKNLFICFPCNGDWYLYPHDDLLIKCEADNRAFPFLAGSNKSWEVDGCVHWPNPPPTQFLELLEEYKLQ